jgi:hypothetical protein
MQAKLPKAVKLDYFISLLIISYTKHNLDSIARKVFICETFTPCYFSAGEFPAENNY